MPAEQQKPPIVWNQTSRGGPHRPYEWQEKPRASRWKPLNSVIARPEGSKGEFVLSLRRSDLMNSLSRVNPKAISRRARAAQLILNNLMKMHLQPVLFQHLQHRHHKISSPGPENFSNCLKPQHLHGARLSECWKQLVNR